MEKTLNPLEGLSDGCAPLCPVGQSVLAGGVFKLFEQRSDANHATVHAGTGTTVRQTLHIARGTRRNRRLKLGDFGGSLLEIEGGLGERRVPRACLAGDVWTSLPSPEENLAGSRRGTSGGWCMSRLGLAEQTC